MMENQSPCCNICGGVTFNDFSNRINVQCSTCKSLERHRLVREAIFTNGFLVQAENFGKKRALHLAPEPMTTAYLAPVFGAAYIASDLNPSRYPHCACLTLRLPDGFSVFPEGYFDLIVHNHVLEHIPGSYQRHLHEFVRLLAPGGVMIFTLPYVDMSATSIEGGEHLTSDELRVAKFGQEDHYKTFGKDFINFMNELPGQFSTVEFSKELRARVRADLDPVYLYRKA